MVKIERELAQAQYEKAIQSAFREVADALAAKGTIEEQLAAQQSLTEAVEVTYRLSNQRYEKGIDSFLGVLDAHRSLYAAQQGLISTRLAQLAARVNLYSVLGGDVDDATPPPDRRRLLLVQPLVHFTGGPRTGVHPDVEHLHRHREGHGK